MRHSSDDIFLGSDRAFMPSEGRSFGASEILATLRRRWRSPGVGCLIGLIIAVFFSIFYATPLYTSTARILIDTKMNQNLQMQKIVEDMPVDTSLVDSQVAIISSESVVLPVVMSMNLTHDTEFVGPPNPFGPKLLWYMRKSISRVKQSLGLGEIKADNPKTILEQTAVATFLKHLNVRREDLTYVMDVSFISEDPQKAARIAAALTDSYLAAELEAKNNSSKLASHWLQERLIELKVQATDADRALQNYKSSHNIVQTGRGLLTEQQLADLTSQVISARTATAEAKARLDRIQQISKDGIPDTTVTDALNNNVITRLRAQYLDSAARAADLAGRVGDKHSSVEILHRQVDELSKSIRNEEKRIADAYASDFEIAKAREKSLIDSMSASISETGSSSQAQVTMRDLESSSDTYRSLYDSFLQKFQQIIQTQSIPVADARVVTKATVPIYKSSPDLFLVLATGMGLGLFVGGGVAIAREMAVDVFRTPNEVEQISGIPCLGILPMITANREQSLRFKDFMTDDIEEFVLDNPHSRFAETLRNLSLSINSAQRTREVKVIGVVSSVANEGKTTVAANFGALLNASMGARTLIIDADFHKRTLTTKLAPDARKGLVEALRNPSLLAKLVYHRRRAGLDVLPCVTDKRIPNAVELLGSPQMESLLEAARESYSYIIIEIAPIASVVDVKVIERFVDSFVLVVDWGRTKRSLVLEALSDAKVIRERLAGIVLNKADPVLLRSLEAYKGDAFSSYYEG